MRALLPFILLLPVVIGIPLLGCTASGPTGEPPDVESVVDADITVSFRRVDDRRVDVSLSTVAPEDGVVVFAATEAWGGVSPCVDEIRDLHVVDAAGAALPTTRPDPNRWRVATTPGRRVRAVWTLRTPDERLKPDWGEHYRPLVDPTLFHAIGMVALVAPEHVQDGRPVRIAIRWSGFDGETLSSFSRGPGPDVVELPFDRFRHAVFLAGDVRVDERSLRGAPLRVAIHDERWSFTDNQFVDLAERVVRMEREFFDDWDHPPYLVSLIPIGADAELSFAYGGTGLTDSFALFMAPGATLAPGTVGVHGVRHLLAHECFHHWNGIDIEREAPEELAYWFSEGFTDYYARLLLWRNGYESLEQTAASLNRSIREYWTSPVRAAPNAAILEAFWTDKRVSDLPYRRGDLVAVVLDQEIRRRSNGARTLDDLMRALHAAAVERGETVSTESLLAEFARWTTPEVAARLRAVVVDGAPLELPAALDDPPLVRTTQLTGTFDLGFDVEASRQTRVITGVRPGSAAAAAGVADGMGLQGLTAYWNDVDRPVEIDVVIDGEVRRIRYQPVRDPVEIPAYRPAEATQ